MEAFQLRPWAKQVFAQNEMEDMQRTISERLSRSRVFEPCAVAAKIQVGILVSALYFFNRSLFTRDTDFLETKNKLRPAADFSGLAPRKDILRAYQ